MKKGERRRERGKEKEGTNPNLRQVPLAKAFSVNRSPTMMQDRVLSLQPTCSLFLPRVLSEEPALAPYLGVPQRFWRSQPCKLTKRFKVCAKWPSLALFGACISDSHCHTDHNCGAGKLRHGTKKWKELFISPKDSLFSR